MTSACLRMEGKRAPIWGFHRAPATSLHCPAARPSVPPVCASPFRFGESFLYREECVCVCVCVCVRGDGEGESEHRRHSDATGCRVMTSDARLFCCMCALEREREREGGRERFRNRKECDRAVLMIVLLPQLLLIIIMAVVVVVTVVLIESVRYNSRSTRRGTGTNGFVHSWVKYGTAPPGSQTSCRTAARSACWPTRYPATPCLLLPSYVHPGLICESPVVISFVSLCTRGKQAGDATAAIFVPECSP